MKQFNRFLIILGLSLCYSAIAQVLDQIAANVNNDIITARQLDERIHQIKQRYQHSQVALPSDSELSKQVLDSLILESLQLQLAQKLNLVLPQHFIDRAIENFAQQQGLTAIQLPQALKQIGQSYDNFVAQLKNELTIQELQKQFILRRIAISETEIDQIIASQTGQTLQNSQYQLSYLRFNGTEDEADQLLEQLNSGTDLLTLDNSRDLGMRPMNEIPSLFRTIVPVLSQGEAIKVILNGVIHIAQLNQKTNNQRLSITEYSIQHILISTNALLDDQSAKALAKDLQTRILAGESMDALANQYTNDNASKGLGGHLGWNTLDTFVPEFAQAASALKQNEVSEIIKTPFGYHIIKVVDTRTRDVALDTLRLQIKNQLTQQRFNEALEQWLSQLRAESYVEVRPL